MSFKHIFYVLDQHKPVPISQGVAWAAWFANSENRIVSKTEEKDVTVSTVFLGLDHQHGDGPPLLFETFIFGGPHDGETERCSTWEEAEEMHKRMEKKVFG